MLQSCLSNLNMEATPTCWHVCSRICWEYFITTPFLWTIFVQQGFFSKLGQIWFRWSSVIDPPNTRYKLSMITAQLIVRCKTLMKYFLIIIFIHIDHCLWDKGQKATPPNLKATKTEEIISWKRWSFISRTKQFQKNYSSYS